MKHAPMTDPDTAEKWRQLWEYFELNQACGLRRIAAGIIARYAWEGHKYGADVMDHAFAARIAIRWKLGEFSQACRAVFPTKEETR